MSNLSFSSIVIGLWSMLGIHGRVFSEPTPRPQLADYDRPPWTTHMVEPPDFRHMAKRRETDMQTEVFAITIAPDATCGFISGSPYNPVTCKSRHYHCAWGSEIGVVICGFLEDKSFSAGIYLQCIEREKALNARLCDDVCQSNVYNLLCTDKSAPHCLTYAYPKGIKEYRCAPTSVVHSVSFTTDNKRAAEFITATVPVEPSPATETEPVTSTIPETSMTIPPSPLPSSKPDSNPGAIIGGAVGGFAALLLIALTIFWFVRRSKRDGAPGKGGPTKTHEMSGEPAHYEMSGEPAHYEMSGEPAHYEMSGEPAHYEMSGEPTHSQA